MTILAKSTWTDGVVRLMSSTREIPKTIFVTLEDHFCCCYQSAIGNSKDFMKEFNHAYELIGEAMEDYNKLFPYLERDYPNHTENQTSIGFRQNEQ